MSNADRRADDLAARLDHEAEQLGWPSPIDLAALARTSPTPPQMIVDDWWPAGYAVLFAGHGGIGKSGIALHVAVCAALGLDFFGLKVHQRKVLYLSCEDRESVLHWRLARICEYRGITMESLAGSLDILDLVGRDAMLWHKSDGALPRAYGLLRAAMNGHEVIVLDGIADVYGGNENARNEVKQFVNAITGLIPAHGAVLLIGHVNKATAGGNGGEGYSGSTGWHNSVRARWYLSPEVGEEGDRSGSLILELQKSNLGQSGQQMRLAWDPEAHLFIGELIGTTTRMERGVADITEQTGILDALIETVDAGDYCPAATNGRRTAWHVLSARNAFPESLIGGSGRRRFWRHIEALRSMAKICEGSIRRADRKRTATLVPAGRENTEVAAMRPMGGDAIGSAIAAGRHCGHAANGQGGYRGARTHTQPCPKCDGEGCGYCRGEVVP